MVDNVGCWLLVAGCWLLVAGCWLLAAGQRLRTSGCRNGQAICRGHAGTVGSPDRHPAGGRSAGGGVPAAVNG
ncbi:hypothetical protein EHV23_04720 [Lautropia dentalis]|uniref:Uncharacterized protein n=1 Tax=Lautropia dentalis TaxID=2490857 RepID=A0A426FS59_9BURK|nr:hypothetical protein EHV23_04720 [Lautropia dentalis]